MSPRIVALTAIAAAVAGLGVYLLVEVQSGPSTPDAIATGSAARATSSGSAAVAANRPTLAPDRPVQPVVAATESAQAGDDTGSGSGSGSDAAPPPDAGVAVATATHGHAPHLFQAPGHAGSKAAKVDHMLDESARAFDAKNYDRAKAIASKIASREPDNARALGILTATACAQNDAAAAQGYYNKLPADARAGAKASCSGVPLQDP